MQRPEVGDAAVTSGEGNSYLLLHGLQCRPRHPRERSSCLQGKSPFRPQWGREGRSARHLRDALLLQIFTGTWDLPRFYTSSPSPGKWPTPSSAPAESTSWHRVCRGWVPPHTAQQPSSLQRGLAGDSTAKQGAALHATCTKHGTFHIRVPDHRLHQWSGVLNRLQWNPRHTAAGSLYTSVMASEWSYQCNKAPVGKGGTEVTRSIFSTSKL